MATLTMAEWSRAFCRTLGNMAPSDLIVSFIVAWGRKEGGGGSSIVGSTNRCNGNMLNTCQLMAGSVHCSSVSSGGCVQSYRNVNDGIMANALALKNGRYPSLLHALETNDENNLGFHGHKMAHNIAGDLSVWVSGSRTANLGYAASVAAMANAQGPDTSKDTTTGGNGNMPNTGTPLDWITNLLGSGTISWINNPIRIVKLVVGVLLIGVSLFLLITPDPVGSVKDIAKVAML